MEDTLIKCGKFSLPGKRALLENTEIDIVLVDVTESPIEHPEKQRQWYSGKKKRHTLDLFQNLDKTTEGDIIPS